MRRDEGPTTSEPHRGSPPPSQARGSALLLALIALLSFTLTACRPDGAPAVRLEASTLAMRGFTKVRFQVTAPASWQLDVLADDPTLGSGITVSPPAGDGNATVTVVVDPTAMPRLDVRFRLRLTAEDRGRTHVALSNEILFTYPDVTGVVVGGPGPAAPVRPDPGASSVTLSEWASGEEAALANLLDAQLLSSPTTTLIVGTEHLPGRGEVGTNSAAGRLTAGAMAAALSRSGVVAAPEPTGLPGLTLVTVPTSEAISAARALSTTAGVLYVEFPRVLEPASVDPLRASQWHLDELGVEALWNVAGGTGVTIAVLDQGFLPSHPDLQPNVVGTYDAAGYGGPAPFPTRECGTHGTHVAGIAAAAANNHLGGAGVAPYARLLLVNLGNSGTVDCLMTTAALIRALDYVVGDTEPRAQVVNMSLGAPSQLGQGVRQALRAAADRGISLVAAAGNDNNACPQATTNRIYYPAAYPEVLAVAATEPGGARACYSNQGSGMFIAAPGGSKARGVLSTTVVFPGAQPDYGIEAGTSMATPAVSGVIALLRSAAPEATAAEIATALRVSAIDKGPPGRDPFYGYGLIDPLGAYERLLARPPLPPTEQGLILRVPGYPDSPLGSDGRFSVPAATPGPLTVEVGTDSSGNGVLGEAGEWYGSATIQVRFGEYEPARANRVEIEVRQLP